MQTEKAKSSHFDRTREDKKQICPTYEVFRILLKANNFQKVSFLYRFIKECGQKFYRGWKDFKR